MSKSHTVVVVKGERRRVFGGVEHRHRLKVLGGGIKGERILKGSYRETNKNGQTIHSTHFNDQKVDGYDPVWLAQKNGIKLKLAEVAAAAAA